MELEFDRDVIQGCEVLADGTVCQEETLESIVPDACPDILRIVAVCGQAALNGKQAKEGMAQASGTVRAVILYQPEAGGGLRRMEAALPFTAQLEAPGLTDRGTVQACVRLRGAEARALNRKLARLSLGGVRDEAEIRGHRKTYIGAMPGRIMTALIQAKSKNALLLLDEIDKLGSDYKGDPSSALLEVLDSAQNSSFRDHYIEVPFDLSHCMFITTANTTDTIPRALLDRMEVIELGSYTDEEKLQIAKRHLLPKQLKKHGMKRTQVRVSDDAIREIIACYTRESGVRSLERQIAALCRKCAMRFVSDEPPKRISITGGNLEDFLGVRKFLPEANVTTDQVGLVTGLAWTAVGGTTLEVEVNVVDGSGKLELTGNLGDVMKESAFAAMSFIRSRAKALGLAPDFYKTKDIHVHFPEGAVPKDGPSAGITICTAIVSALTNRPVRRDVAMTGEISIRGRVLAIGGLKEKTMAALRHGVKTVIIPAENEKDLEEIDQTVRQALQFITVSSADRVLEAALLPAGDATETISVPAAPALPIPAPKTRRKPGIRQ